MFQHAKNGLTVIYKLQSNGKYANLNQIQPRNTQNFEIFKFNSINQRTLILIYKHGLLQISKYYNSEWHQEGKYQFSDNFQGVSLLDFALNSDKTKFSLLTIDKLQTILKVYFGRFDSHHNKILVDSNVILENQFFSSFINLNFNIRMGQWDILTLVH